MKQLLSQHATSTFDTGYIVDLGGATLDLQGGVYLLSQPVAVPPFFGNLRIMDGTLRASGSFPEAGYLIEIGDDDVCQSDHSAQDTCNVDVGVQGVFLDAYQVGMLYP